MGYDPEHPTGQEHYGISSRQIQDSSKRFSRSRSHEISPRTHSRERRVHEASKGLESRQDDGKILQQGSVKRRSRTARSKSRSHERSRNQVYYKKNDTTTRNNEKMLLDEKRLIERRKYEEDRLKQVKEREDQIARDLFIRQENLKRKTEIEERRLKAIEEERWRKEQNLYKGNDSRNKRRDGEHHRYELSERSNYQHEVESSRRSSSLRSAMSNISSEQLRSRYSRSRSRSNVSFSHEHGHDRVVKDVPLSPSPEMSNVRKPVFSRSRSPSRSSRKIFERVGPSVPLKDRLGYRPICKYCGEKEHRSLNERRKKCIAYGNKCGNCGKMNHLRRMCRQSNIEVVTSDEDVVNNNKMNRDIFTTVDQIGYTEVSSKEIEVTESKKSPVDLSKVVIKRRSK